MPERLRIENARDFWFGGDLTVYADIGPNETVVALPAQEVSRGMIYLEKLKVCTAYEAAEELYYQFTNDPSAPKLIPRIIDPMGDFECVDNLFAQYLTDIGIAEDGRLNYFSKKRDYINYWMNPTKVNCFQMNKTTIIVN
jgi:hypothetical protein